MPFLPPDATTPSTVTLGSNPRGRDRYRYRYRQQTRTASWMGEFDIPQEQGGQNRKRLLYRYRQ
jgi:hypothetical protein